MSKYFKPKEQWAVYEKQPAHGSDVNGIILGDYNTKEEAQEAREKYGYNTENYYVDSIKTKTNMITVAQVIELDGRFFGHNITDGEYGLDRVWHDDIRHAIMWGSDRDIPLDRISCPTIMREELMSAKLIKVKVTKIIEIID